MISFLPTRTVFNAARSPRFYITLIAIALLIGLPVVSSGMMYNNSIDWQAPDPPVDRGKRVCNRRIKELLNLSLRHPRH